MTYEDIFYKIDSEGFDYWMENYSSMVDELEEDPEGLKELISKIKEAYKSVAPLRNKIEQLGSKYYF